MQIFLKDERHLLTYGLSHKEFKCKCKSETCRATLVTDALLDAYKHFREKVKTPLLVTSGYRCPKHNAAVGGSPVSRHTAGQAVDILYTTALKNSYSASDIINIANSCGFKFIKFYSEGSQFFHMDVRTN